MTIRYLASQEFDAKQEGEALLSLFSNPGTETLKLYSVIDVIHSLDEAAKVGFIGIAHKWEPTSYKDIFLYSNAGILAAINVPGNGHAQTFDLTLVGIYCVEGREGDEDAKLGIEEFLRTMDRRRKTGAEHDWH